jgi:hypothetical protein
VKHHPPPDDAGRDKLKRVFADTRIRGRSTDIDRRYRFAVEAGGAASRWKIVRFAKFIDLQFDVKSE